MKKILFIFTIILNVSISPIIGQEYSCIPNPDMYGKQFTQVVKQGDSTHFVNTFSIKPNDLKLLMTNLLSDPIIRKKINDDFYTEYTSDSIMLEITKELHSQLSESFGEIKKWKNRDSINLQKLEYVRTFCNLEYTMESPIWNLRNTTVLCKYDTIYYGFEIKELILVNGLWRGTKISDIIAYDSKFERTYPHLIADDYGYPENYEYAADTLPIDSTSAYSEYDYYSDQPYDSAGYANQQAIDYVEPKVTRRQKHIIRKRQRAYDKYIKYDNLLYE